VEESAQAQKNCWISAFCGILKTSSPLVQLIPMTKAVILWNALLCGALFAQSASPASNNPNASAPAKPVKPGATAPAKSGATAPKAVKARYRPERFGGRAGTYYRLIWGIDDLSVKSAEGGEVIRFTYQVLDPDKAKMLNNKRIEPSLIDEQAQVKLVVPQMEKVGKLRQTADPVSGRTYWMLFSNKGGHVKRGDHVSVIIGDFRADGLVVD
jgi:hypothetical protein